MYYPGPHGMMGYPSQGGMGPHPCYGPPGQPLPGLPLPAQYGGIPGSYPCDPHDPQAPCPGPAGAAPPAPTGAQYDLTVHTSELGSDNLCLTITSHSSIHVGSIHLIPHNEQCPIPDNKMLPHHQGLPKRCASHDQRSYVRILSM